MPLSHVEHFIRGTYLPNGIYTLHSQYNSVVNFVDNRDEIVYVTNEMEKMAANAIFVPFSNLEHINSLQIEDEYLFLGRMELQQSAMQTYKAKINFNQIDLETTETSLLSVYDCFGSLFSTDSLAFLLKAECNNDQKDPLGFKEAFFQNSILAYQLIRNGDVLKGIEKLRGTGFGLTPSGDDFIAGILLGLHFNEAKYRIKLDKLRDDIYSTSLSENIFTNSFLKQAYLGNHFWGIKNFLHLNPIENEVEYTEGLKKILSIGSTSGADFLTGYITAIKQGIRV